MVVPPCNWPFIGVENISIGFWLVLPGSDLLGRKTWDGEPDYWKARFLEQRPSYGQISLFCLVAIMRAVFYLGEILKDNCSICS